MKIDRLMDQHRQFESRGLPGSLGDGYLVAHNSFFRRIREKALSQGYRFSSEPDPAYETFPLLRLEYFLRKRILPYSENVSAFRELSPTQLNRLDWDDVDGNLKKNSVFHEASHAVAHDLIEQKISFEKLPSLDGERLLVLRMLLEESCANTTELLGVIDVHDQTHRCFYNLNSYMTMFEARTNLKRAVADFGLVPFTKFMICAYLSSNLLQTNFTDKDFDSMLKISGLVSADPKKRKTLRATGKIAFELSERFRFQTTGFHVRLAGIQTPLEDLFDFDAFTLLGRQKGLSDFLESFSAIFSAQMWEFFLSAAFD